MDAPSSQRYTDGKWNVYTLGLLNGWHAEYGGMYDYTDCGNLWNDKSQVRGECREHGVFYLTVKAHKKRGCQRCGKARSAASRVKSTSDVVASLMAIYGNKYDFTRTVYSSRGEKIPVICPLHGEFWRTTQELRSGNECTGCMGRGTVTDLESFKKEAARINKNKWGYESSTYSGYDRYTVVTCSVHGKFPIRVASHLKGMGCLECAGKKWTPTQFYNVSRQTHGSAHDLGFVMFDGIDDLVDVLCKHHDTFFSVTAREYMTGIGCPMCASDTVSTPPPSARWTIDESDPSIDDIDYSLNDESRDQSSADGTVQDRVSDDDMLAFSKYTGRVTDQESFDLKVLGIWQGANWQYIDPYKGATELMRMICPRGHPVKQTPSNHYRYGCIVCRPATISEAKMRTYSEFVCEIQACYPNWRARFDLSKVEYAGNTTRVMMGCLLHHVWFHIRPDVLLRGKGGCKLCKRHSHSWMAIDWLTYKSVQYGYPVQHAENGGEFKIPGTNMRADGYIKEINLVLEFHGDYWHGNPEQYDSNDINKLVGLTYGELHTRTVQKEECIRALGFDYECIWESAWKRTRRELDVNWR